jgi:hypothetical protein
MFITPFVALFTVVQEPAVATLPAPLTLTLPAEAHEPELAVDDTGTVAVVAASKEAAYVFVSRDRGVSFGAARKLPFAGQIAVGMRRGPKIAIHGDRLCVVLIAGERGGGKDGDVLASSSNDFGVTWTEPARINSVADTAREGLHALASGPQGELGCIWVDLRTEHPEVFGAVSTDGGARWGENRRISGPAGTVLCPCCSPSLACDRDGMWYATWRTEKDGARDLVLATSKDAFASTTHAERLGSKSWKIAVCPMDGGAVRAAGDDVCLAWRSDADVFAGSSRRTSEAFPVGKGLQPMLAIGREAHVVWSEKLGGVLRWRAFGKGFAGGPARELAPQATAGVVASSPTRGKGPVVAAWETSYTADGRILVQRLEP